MTTNKPADCVCNLGHCAACLSAGIVCDRPGCRNVRVDGKPCPGRVPPPPPSGARRAPAMPTEELSDVDASEEAACVDCIKGRAVDCIRNDGHGGECIPRHDPRPTPRVCTTSDGLVDALQASLRPAPTPPALLTPRERAARKERHEERAQLGRLRASTESYPARALSLDDLDAHERPRYSVMRSRA